MNTCKKKREVASKLNSIITNIKKKYFQEHFREKKNINFIYE